MLKQEIRYNDNSDMYVLQTVGDNREPLGDEVENRAYSYVLALAAKVAMEGDTLVDYYMEYPPRRWVFRYPVVGEYVYDKVNGPWFYPDPPTVAKTPGNQSKPEE